MKQFRGWITALFIVLIVSVIAYAGTTVQKDQMRFASKITPQVQFGNGDALDMQFQWDGNAQDYYLCLDDSADDLLIGAGETCGTTPVLNIIGDGSSATTATRLRITGNTTEANTPVTLLELNTAQAVVSEIGMGIGIDFSMPDGTGTDVEVMATMDIVQTDITAATNEADISFSHIGAIAANSLNESLRLIADYKGTTSGTSMRFSSNSAETDGVLYPLVLRQSGGTTVAGFGVGIDLQAEFADGVETAGKMEAVWTDVGTGSEDADMVFSAKDAGSVVELIRFDSDGSIIMEGATDDAFRTIITATDPTADRTIILPNIDHQIAITETVTTTAEALLVAADCGKTIYLNHASTGIALFLPAISGLSGCEFTIIHMTVTSDDHSINTNGGADIIVVQSYIADGNAGITDDNADIISFVDTADTAGDTCEVNNNGTKWHIRCYGAANGAFSSATS